MRWSNGPPPSGTEVEFETVDGQTLTGHVSFVSSFKNHTGKRVRQYKLQDGKRGVFDVVRWRRVSRT